MITMGVGRGPWPFTAVGTLCKAYRSSMRSTRGSCKDLYRAPWAPCRLCKGPDGFRGISMKVCIHFRRFLRRLLEVSWDLYKGLYIVYNRLCELYIGPL